MMQLGMALRPMLALVCGVCGLIRDSEKCDEDRILAKMLGKASAYDACPCCHRLQYGNAADPEYRRRVRVWLFEKTGVVLRVP